MKKIIFLLSLLLLIPSVLAISGGESFTLIHIDNCVNISVEVFGEDPIDPGEYELLNCTRINTTFNITTNLSNKWFCNCNGSTDLILTTQQNTINNYSFMIDYTYSQNIITPPAEGGSGISNIVGSGGSSHYFYNDTNATFYVNPALQFVSPPKKVEPKTPEPVVISTPKNITVPVPVPVVILDTVNETVVEEVSIEGESLLRTLGIVFGVLMAILGIIGLILWLIFRKKDKKEPEQTQEEIQELMNKYGGEQQ